MITRPYSKKCNLDRLTLEFIAAGLVVYPNPGARFYGFSCDQVGSDWVTSVMLYDDITQQEIATADDLVAAHVPIPVPPIPEFTKDSEGKIYTRTEPRPLGCTTVFTSAGDVIGTPNSIGAGTRLAWDASKPGEFATDGAPTGFKRKVIDLVFCDPIWARGGTAFYKGCVDGSFLDLYIMCPPTGYYMYMGQVYQNNTQEAVVMEHNVIKMPLIGSTSSGADLDSQTASQPLPSGYQLRMIVTIPESDVTSEGAVLLFMYRQRTVIMSV